MNLIDDDITKQILFVSEVITYVRAYIYFCVRLFTTFHWYNFKLYTLTHLISVRANFLQAHVGINKRQISKFNLKHPCENRNENYV